MKFVTGDLEGQIYPFLNWSSTNAYTSSLFSLNNEYTFSFLGAKPSFNSIAWSQAFHTGILSDSFFPNTFFHLQNILGTNFLSTSSSLSFSAFFTSFLSPSCFFFPHIGGQCVILTSTFFQSISRLWTVNHSIPNITSIFPRLHTLLRC